MTDTDYFDIRMMKRYRARYFDKDNKLLGISYFDAGFEEANGYAFTYRSVSTARIELYKVMDDGSFDFLGEFLI